jgi:hypothetical protein
VRFEGVHEGVREGSISGDSASEDAGRGIGLWKDNRSAGEEDERNKCEWTGKGNEEVHVERGLGAMGDEQDKLRRRTVWCGRQVGETRENGKTTRGR